MFDLEMFGLPEDVGDVETNTWINMSEFSFEQITLIHISVTLVILGSFLTTEDSWKTLVLCQWVTENWNLPFSRSQIVSGATFVGQILAACLSPGGCCRLDDLY
jgi:hypothetical protein